MAKPIALPPHQSYQEDIGGGEQKRKELH